MLKICCALYEGNVVWEYKLLFFKQEHPPALVLNYLVDHFFEVFDVPNLKFEIVVSQTLKCIIINVE